jgi:branched-chain amino acid transport system permease protein
MSVFFQQIVDGLANGAGYAFIALALSLVFRASSAANFAQAEMATLAAFVALALQESGLPLVWSALIAISASFALGSMIQQVLIRKIDSVSFDGHMAILLVTLGLFLLINGGMGYIWGYDTKQFPSLVGDRRFDVAGARFSSSDLLIAGSLTVVCVLLFLLFRYTRLGLAMRATAESPESTALLGVNIQSTLRLAWGLAGALGAIAAILLAPRLFLEPNMMAGSLLFGFAGAVLGGLDSVVGAVIGGLIIGVVTNLAATYVDFIGADLSIVVPFVVIALVLYVRPEGLLGSRKVVRV